MGNRESREELKTRLLRLLYEGRDCNYLGISFFDLPPKLKLDQNMTESLMRELQQNGLLRLEAQDVSITPDGIDLLEEIDSDRPEIYELRSKRLMVLRKYYEIRDDYYGAEPSEIAQELRLEDKVAEDIFWYHTRKNFLKASHLSSKLKITYEGISEVERYAK